MASHKILVIDDSRVIQKTVKSMLPPGNFDVVEAKDGEEGLKKIRSDKPSLIMLDFLLPKKSGWEVFQEIQAHDDLRKIPLVVMSGRKEEVTEKISEPFEFFEFIEKPFEKKQLIGAIKTAMSKAKKPRAAVKAAPAAAASTAASGGEDVAALQAKVAAMEKEIATLKKQITQILTFIKQKLK
ncbi:two-component system response regulator [Leptolyngbya valderiana BDU 20041]|uniref:response regulator n=1 Tax=Baaleninema simplex TaxID=2862350 RepID=UPI0004774D3E|nr:response regulator [Baaleninema simplex]MDC0832183.1 response regulator [Geitlerinema sp. CS-897]OAB59979.1 two-component system response regulator [Leptolyngbya valderiana BDU 20041]PPT08375.1 two-component response regulator [Geitlerinema sp. FC II]